MGRSVHFDRPVGLVRRRCAEPVYHECLLVPLEARALSERELAGACSCGRQHQLQRLPAAQAALDAYRMTGLVVPNHRSSFPLTLPGMNGRLSANADSFRHPGKGTVPGEGAGCGQTAPGTAVHAAGNVIARRSLMTRSRIGSPADRRGLRSLSPSRFPTMSTPFSLPAVKRTWSTDDICALRELSQQGLPVAIIARRLGRTESAIRNKAAMHGVPVRSVARTGEAISTDRSAVSQSPA